MPEHAVSTIMPHMRFIEQRVFLTQPHYYREHVAN